MMSSMESSPQSGLPGSISGRQTMLGENDDKQKNTDPEGKTKQKTITKLVIQECRNADSADEKRTDGDELNAGMKFYN